MISILNHQRSVLSCQILVPRSIVEALATLSALGYKKLVCDWSEKCVHLRLKILLEQVDSFHEKTKQSRSEEVRFVTLYNGLLFIGLESVSTNPKSLWQWRQNILRVIKTVCVNYARITASSVCCTLFVRGLQ